LTDEKKFEQEYKKLKCQAAPDLWDRIEGNLKEHPEREQRQEKNAQETKTQELRADGQEPQEPQEAGQAAQESGKVVRLADRRPRPVYGAAAAAAAFLVLVMRQNMMERPEMTAETTAAAAYVAEVVEEGAKEAAPAAAGAAESQAAAPSEAAEAAGPGTVEPGAAAGAVQDQAASQDAEGPGKSMQRTSGGAAPAALQATAAVSRLRVPGDALTVSEDARYFSESILGDTELLCGAKILSAELEQDASGRAVKVSYEVVVEHVDYAEDYISAADTITVKSPIISTEGDTAYVLYQLLPGNTYLLPLVLKDGCFELLYPFAPQIQVTEQEEYLFHSGFSSLVNPDTAVTVKESEGPSDYYYDRMLIRTDDNFLSDLAALIEREAQGRK